MLAYSTTNTLEDGPILSSPEGKRPNSPLDVTSSGLKEVALLRHSKLSRNEMGSTSTVAPVVNWP